MFRFFNCPLDVRDREVSVKGRPSLSWRGREDLAIPGDLSAAAFFLVGASILPDSEILIRNVGVNPTRTGVLEILGRMGASIEILNEREQAGEPVADLRVQPRRLRGVSIGAGDIPRTIDEFPILCVAAALAEGETVISGAEELRVKESDRISTMAAELRNMGAAIQERPDGLVIQGAGGARLRGTRGQSHGDHRVAMSLAIAALVGDAPTQIADTDCIETSFPGFEQKLSDLLT
jgi:3-phosphoshikimate 1-carboxyvinyltransferase